MFTVYNVGMIIVIQKVNLKRLYLNMCTIHPMNIIDDELVAKCIIVSLIIKLTFPNCRKFGLSIATNSI